MKIKFGFANGAKNKLTFSLLIFSLNEGEINTVSPGGFSSILNWIISIRKVFYGITLYLLKFREHFYSRPKLCLNFID